MSHIDRAFVELRMERIICKEESVDSRLIVGEKFYLRSEELLVL